MLRYMVLSGNKRIWEYSVIQDSATYQVTTPFDNIKNEVGKRKQFRTVLDRVSLHKKLKGQLVQIMFGDGFDAGRPHSFLYAQIRCYNLIKMIN